MVVMENKGSFKFYGFQKIKLDSELNVDIGLSTCLYSRLISAFAGVTWYISLRDQGLQASAELGC
jgi:hypothetical protein